MMIKSCKIEGEETFKSSLDQLLECMLFV